MSEQEVFDALKYRIVVDGYGTRRYYNSNNQLHRESGPAVEYVDGHKEWYDIGRLHRIDGPAIVYADDSSSWWQDGELHRIDGPAIEWPSGNKAWYINGVELTEAEFNQAVKQCLK